MQNIIVVHSNIKSKFFNITHVRYLYNNDWCSSMTSFHGGTHPGVPLRPLLMSIHGVAFTVTDGTMNFIFHLIEFTRIIHIITVTLLHIIHLVTEALLLPSPLSHLSHDHVQDIVLPLYTGHFDGSSKGSNIAVYVFSSADSE
jgi:hypothetical protein